MRRRLPVLNLRIASPCRVMWDEMEGTDRVRACTLCSKQVFNISRLTREEIEALVIAHAGNVCVTYYQRSDGTILLADCTYHEQRGGWLPAIAASAVFGAAVIAGTPADSDDTFDDITMYAGGLSEQPVWWLNSLPVIAVTEEGDITYRGELIATARPVYRSPELAIDLLYARLHEEANQPVKLEEPRPPWDRAVILMSHGTTDMRVISRIVSTAKRAGYFVLFSAKTR